MRTLKRQRGLGWFGLLYVFGSIAFIAICAIKIGPLYLNEMNIAKAVKGTADNPENANAEVVVIRQELTRRWDTDYIDQLEPRDVLVKRDAQGRFLFYDYDARVNLFYNVFVVVNFTGSERLRPGQAG